MDFITHTLYATLFFVFLRSFKVTCAHGLAELEQTLKGEIRDMRRAPFSCGRVVVLLIAQPAGGLLPETVLELIQLHVGLRQLCCGCSINVPADNVALYG